MSCATGALVMFVGAAAAQVPPASQAPQAPQALPAPQAPQAPQGPAEPQAQPDASPAPASGNKPGFIDAFGRWIGDSVSNWNAGLKGAADVAKDAADAATAVTKDTAGAVARIPGARVISERATCPTAPNGAPDCRAAAEAICKGHGFASGSSVDFQTAEKCPPIALNRQDREPAICTIESYVTRALCQ
ncbi:MAG TPA: hypothetical protein VH249_01210 [Xanthobacteraceae bacterium]|nr:hypothetical protein [Xanthobacteraceae bacterium]